EQREQLYQLQQLQQQLQLQQKLQQQQAAILQQINDKQPARQQLSNALPALRQRYKTLNERIKDKKQLLAQQLLIMQLSEHRSRLQPEQPCPLCGATEHPAVQQYQQLNSSETEQQLQALETELTQIQQEGEQLNKADAALQAELQQLDRQQAYIANELAGLAAAMPQTTLAAVAASLATLSASLNQTGQQLTEVEQWQQQQQQRKEQRQQLSALLADNHHQQQLIAQRTTRLSEQQTELATQFSTWQQQWQATRQPEPSSQTTAANLADISTALQLLQQQIQQWQGQQQVLQRQQQQLQQTLQHSTAQWQQALHDSCFTDEAAFNAALLSDAEVNTLHQLQQRLQQSEIAARRLLADWQQRRQILAAQQLSALSAAELSNQLQQLEQQVQQLTEQLGQLQQQLTSDTQRRTSQQQLLEQIAVLQQQYEYWQRLNSLIGSADGAKYRRFAQGLTLQQLITLANRQLALLHNRYQLARHSDAELELVILDTWQADSPRDTKTLSGGESFLVSLALALALSDLVSNKTRIDSLFLDEGFGTLDADTLDSALSALDNLNASGKMIGIISHVDALKQRISVQIKVEKQQGLGYSQIKISS
ncbi:MAG TPA: SbcC/MukB-like Walker B domain-containing protein, partial [Rheinheimera sp.]|nr:SbcC/MukB-like Walker B domain-containing protein [Rheinheimera sp.]